MLSTLSKYSSTYWPLQLRRDEGQTVNALCQPKRFLLSVNQHDTSTNMEGAAGEGVEQHIDADSSIDEDEERQPDLEIVGLLSDTNGRSCCQHDVCGKHVRKGDVLVLRQCVVPVHGKIQEAIKLIKVEDGCERCTVAYVPRAFVSNPKIAKNINHFVQVLEIYEHSSNTYKRRLAHQNCGMASVAFLNDVLSFEPV